MNRLKSVLADKIIDVSSSEANDLKIKLDKINRFRDFTEACHTLIEKYPEIEDEFIRMVKNNDFDAKVAASRVDTIIRLSQNHQSVTEQQRKEDISELEDIKSNEEINQPLSSDLTEPSQAVENSPSRVFHETEIPQTEIPQYLPEDIDYEEISDSENEDDKEYAQYEEIDDKALPSPDEIIDFTDNTSEQQPKSENIEENKPVRNENIKRVVQVIGAVIIIVLFIFLVVFVINNWQTVLWVLAGVLVVALLIWFLKRKNNKE